ncbi:MAG: Rrf2 family transcriptional regulator [Clostridiales bacterium]|nr:Rrf2 family transcriptional regulator [Clostridiales bacterium]
MKLTSKGRYGLRAIVDLAIHSEQEPVSIKSISMRQGISERYLEQIIAKMKRSGLVESVRGAAGGYHLAKNPSDISVGDILRCLEGDLSIVNCPEINETKCEVSQLCVTKYVWQKINGSIQHTINHITLDELVEQSKALLLEHEGEK